MQLGKGAVVAVLGLMMASGALAFDRQLMQAAAPLPASAALVPAPAPAVAAKQAANGVFIFDAATVTFTNATTMTLSGLPNSTAYVQYPPRVSGGTFAKDVFFSTQLKDSASGKWLGGPQVLLQGTMSGNVTDVIVIMNAPVYDSKTKDVTARYEIYNGTDAALPASGGVANSALSSVASASTGTSSPTLLTIVPANGVMANVTAFVDATNIAQYTSSQGSVGEKAGLIRVPLGYSWPGVYGGYYP
ncbi:hypothetical protein CVIRNUC_006010 [Coccomyxa viridis]|uniref:Uncharacterized protein n=1 Tax=Coccomyxa viridis TaxID=1274662 RepID=A0AAV1I8G3_9CHLO|nr:hypothetical protein CVIRNUC_006010 [Coccomyxa viridis]